MSKLNTIKTLSVAAGAACLALSTTGAAQAFQINSSAFGSGAVVESFEGLSVGPNLDNPFGGYLVPGVNSPFTFASGVTLTGPIPSNLNNVIVGDFSLGGADFGLGGNGSIGSAGDVPDGIAYLGINSDSNRNSIEFTFASDILRVGGFVTGATYSGSPANNIITLSAFDALNNLLETVSVSGVDVSNWGANFLGLENSGGIRKITINGDFTVLDKLTFEAGATQAVPEPASVLGLLALGALGMGKGLKRKQ